MAKEPVVSELLEPLLGDTFGWCFRDLRNSKRREKDWQLLATQVQVLDRITIINRSGLPVDDSTGIHASLAMSSLRGKVQRLLDTPLAKRNAFLKKLDNDRT